MILKIIINFQCIIWNNFAQEIGKIKLLLMFSNNKSY